MNSTPRQLRHQPTSTTTKEVVLLFWLFFGWAGAHRMLLGNVVSGVLYLCVSVITCGLGGVLGYADGFVQLLGTPKDRHGLPVVWSWQRGKLVIDPMEEATYSSAESVMRIGLHLGTMFVLPFAVVVGGFSLFETSEVQQTSGRFFLLAMGLLAPLLAVQLFGGLRKARAQIGMLRAAHALSRRTWLDAVARAVQIVTPKGFLVLLTGLLFLVLSLSLRWAQLGVIAVVSLSVFYAVTSAASLYSAFVVRRFSNDLLRRGASVQRRYEPPVARASETVRDTLDVKGVPVPPGFFLTVVGKLPKRLATEVRHVVSTKSRDQRLQLSVQLERTPRGTYDAPPLQIAFTDLLGLTSASVASLSTARIRILPAVRPAEVVPPPQSNTEEPDPLLRPHRFPNEDLFRFREYISGDDTRRIHWELSMKAGRMIVKMPDSKESSAKRVVVALDTWIPPHWLDHTDVIDDALDSLVDAWLSIAQRLESQGEKVTLLLVARGEDGTLRPELVRAGENHALGLDAGARAEWQSTHRMETVLEHGVGADKPSARPDDSVAFDNAIVVTMLLAQPVPSHVARQTTWVFYDPSLALGPPPRSVFDTWVDYDDSGRHASLASVARRLLFLPHPAGAEENGLLPRLKAFEQRLEERAHRLALRHRAMFSGEQALAALMALPDAVYRLEVVDGHHRLVGLKGHALAPGMRGAA